MNRREGMSIKLQRIGEQNAFLPSIWLFRRGIALFFLLDLLLALPYASFYWGQGSLIRPEQASSGWLGEMLGVLGQPSMESWYPLFMVLLAVSCMGMLWGKWPGWMALLCFLSADILYNRAYAYTNVGQELMILMAFYAVFMNEKALHGSGPVSILRRTASNLSVWAVRLQLAMVYLLAGLHKLTGVHWLKGDALAYVLSALEFTPGWLPQVSSFPPWMILLGTWTGLAYQLAFPLLVWFKRIRKPLLIAGVVFHVVIGVVVGLMEVSLAMLVGYLVFWGSFQDRTISICQ